MKLSFKAQSCHGCLEEILPVEMKSFFDELNTKYMKIEFDPNMSHEEKTPHMVTWWSTAHAKEHFSIKRFFFKF